MAFYTTSLASVVGPLYQAPSLVFLAKRWFDASSKWKLASSYDVCICSYSFVDEIRHAARILFDAAVTRLSDEASIVLAERWQHHCAYYIPFLSAY